MNTAFSASLPALGRGSSQSTGIENRFVGWLVYVNSPRGFSAPGPRSSGPCPSGGGPSGRPVAQRHAGRATQSGGHSGGKLLGLCSSEQERQSEAADAEPLCGA